MVVPMVGYGEAPVPVWYSEEPPHNLTQSMTTHQHQMPPVVLYLEPTWRRKKKVGGLETAALS